MKTIDFLKEKCAELLEQESKNDNEKRITILSTISQILNQQNALIKLDAEIVLNILKDLGFSSKEIPQIYASILKEN